MGTVNYRADTGTGILKNYGLRVTYTSSVGYDDYTINGWTGPLVDLVAILVAGIDGIRNFATTFLKAILVAAGITLSSGAIKSALTTTVKCQKTTYKWTLQDTTLSSHTGTHTSYKYYVTDTNYHTDETYYEGYKISDWGKQALGVWLHNDMFPYQSFEIVSWR